MREIEFRAWTKKYKKMVCPKDVRENLIPIEKTEVGFRLKTHFILMQFTGLLDKNGKKIFEGDIILIESEWKDVIIAETGEGPTEVSNQIIPVVFQNGCFGVNLEHDDWFDKRFYSFREIEETSGQNEFEILGNTFENPELLTS